ncbi:Elongation factor 1-delta [Liparis tanakae]|uniref:Elongation factor 1-delta n=1 Tax=Liparis tanakae TaxID=230148 RepID=A0A4Z2IGN8_9TELE|nr:Elongation factor 1-delta [Liparis tanakae]
MSQKTPQCSALDQSELDPPPGRCQVDRPAKAAPGCRSTAECAQRNGEAASSSPESGSLNGDGKRGGKSRRRKKRSSNPESRPDGKADVNAEAEEKPDKRAGRPPPDPRAELTGLKSECAHVWLQRGVYERAESLYQCWLTGSSQPTAESNRSPPAPGSTGVNVSRTVELLPQRERANCRGPLHGPATPAQWDDETDMVKLEECVRSVAVDGLLWGTSKLVPVGYGIQKLQISCVVEDDKVGTDILEEEITKFEDYIQSVDVAAFNKI